MIEIVYGYKYDTNGRKFMFKMTARQIAFISLSLMSCNLCKGDFSESSGEEVFYSSNRPIQGMIIETDTRGMQPDFFLGKSYDRTCILRNEGPSRSSLTKRFQGQQRIPCRRMHVIIFEK